ncbi:MAG: response regulator [Lachnospiraceae bacterium]|nr:response regulator [Lachnospiraceae bacterium]
MYTILIVDDTPVTLRNIKSLLDKKYEVILATSGKQALKLIPEKAPDIILLDYQMPEMSGKEVFEIMQEDEEMKKIPVIFLTGVSDRKTIYSVLKLKPAGYILKPAEEEKLLDTIGQVAATLEESEEHSTNS